MTSPHSLTTALQGEISAAIRTAGGWIGFDRFMAMALYTPGLGYYANTSLKFGTMPTVMEDGQRVTGSDFVTAPEMSPLFGRALAAQIAEALEATGTREVWEFGAGSGALALQLLEALGDRIDRYTIVDLSGVLRGRQQAALAAFEGKVVWVDALPEAMHGVVVGNEVLDAMPVQLLARVDGEWFERGVAEGEGDAPWAWQDRTTDLRPPVDIEGPHDYLTEIHAQGVAFIHTLAERLQRGAAFFLDYGFPEGEYYHPQRSGGTVMCHRAHRADPDPLADVGLKDITAHVNFTAIALAGQDAGLEVLGYANQARFLMNCGLLARMEQGDVMDRARAIKLIQEHEMGELFKVVGFAKGTAWDAIGFKNGDRSHTL
nr:SAM-dependent methyltransferase [Rhodoferax koreense]